MSAPVPKPSLADRLRAIVRGSPSLYELHLRLSRKPGDLRMPRADDVLHLAAFPRTANTLALYLLHAAAPGQERRVSSHVHVPAAIRVALRLGVPTVVLIRDPLEALTSLLVMRRAAEGDQRAADSLLSYYNTYYQYVEAKREQLEVVDFQTVVDQPAQFLRIATSAAPDLQLVADLPAAIEAGVQLHAERNAERLPEDRTVPDARKNRLKAGFRDLLQSRAGYQCVVELYGRLSPGPLNAGDSHSLHP
jgi:hypothetical protein